MVVYLATNAVNGKQYVGITAGLLLQRRAAHFAAAKRGEPTKFARAIRKYGRDAFTFAVLQECASRPELRICEMAWIQKLNSVEHGYNISLGGDGEIGRVWSDQQKAAARDAAVKRDGSRYASVPAKLRAFYKTAAGQAQLANRREVGNRWDVRMKISRAMGGRRIEALRAGENAGFFDTQKEAAIALGVSRSSISMCLAGKFQQTGGYAFRFAA